jgi:hypothetical protein
MRRAVFGNGVFFSSPSSQFDEVPSYRSVDGLTWEARSIPRGDVAFGNGVFVHTTDQGIFTSSDAASWRRVEQTLDFGSDSMVRFADGLFVASDLGRNVETSTDGATWKVVAHEDFDFDSVVDALPFEGGVVLSRATGGGDGPVSGVVGFTPDFHAWNQGPLEIIQQLTTFQAHVVAAHPSAQVLHLARSADAVSWEDGPGIDGDTLAIAASDKTIVAATSCAIKASTDGVHWVDRQAR